VDLTGDGHADVMITEDEIFTWYPSMAEEGFGPSEMVRKVFDEEKGPRLVFNDGTSPSTLPTFPAMDLQTSCASATERCATGLTWATDVSAKK